MGIHGWLRASGRLLALVCLFGAGSGFAGMSATPNPSNGGYHTVSWSAVGGAEQYRLQESIDGGSSFYTVYSGTGLSWSAGSRNAGTHWYRLQTCTNEWMDVPPNGEWRLICHNSSVPWVSVDVINLPIAPWSITVPWWDIFDGGVELSWSAVNGATYYVVEQQLDTWGNTWAVANSSVSGPSLSLDNQSRGNWRFRVKACNTHGCSGWTTSAFLDIENLVNIHTPGGSGTTDPTIETPVSAGVDHQGNATAQVPIDLPPGPGGLQPGLSLAYSSDGGKAFNTARQVSGLLGYGWSLKGIPAISRCRVGVGGEVQMDSTDALCLDGKRLVATSGSYWSDTAEYRTEVQSWLRVYARGSGLANRWFEVHAPDGHVFRFGDTAASRVEPEGSSTLPYRWSVTHEDDSFGNTITYNWYENRLGGGNYPTSIVYGPTTVTFGYLHRDDTLQVGVEAGMTSTSIRKVNLARIAVTFDGELIREYRLEHETIPQHDGADPDDQSVLRYVRVCGVDSGIVACALPVTIDWASPAGAGVYAPMAKVVSGVASGFGRDWAFDYETLPGRAAVQNPVATPGCTAADGSPQELGQHQLYQVPVPWWEGYCAPHTVGVNDALSRLVVEQFDHTEPDGPGAVRRYLYTGDPLYDSKGRGFVGFPQVRVDDIGVEVYDRANDAVATVNSMSLRQYSLDPLLYGKLSRVETYLLMPEPVGGATPGTRYVPTRHAVMSWKHLSLPGGSSAVWLDQRIDRLYELKDDFQRVSVSTTSQTTDYCWRELSSGTCPSSGLLREYPTRLTTASAIGTSVSSFAGAGWAQFQRATVSGQVGYSGSVSDFTNTISYDRWRLGFVNRLEESWGTTGPATSTVTTFSPETAHSPVVGSMTSHPGDPAHELITHFSYDSTGALASKVDTDGTTARFLTIGARTHGLFPVSITNQAWHTTDLTNYDPRSGSPTQITAPDGTQTTVVYDVFGRTVATYAPDGTEVLTLFEACGAQVSCSQVTWADAKVRVTVETSNNGTQTAPRSRVYLDGAGRTVLEEVEGFRADNAVAWRSVETHYDGRGLVSKTSLPYLAGETVRYTVHHHDEKGRLRKQDLPDGTTATVDVIGAVGTVHIDRSHAGHTKRETYNILGQLVEVKDAFGTAEEVAAQYTYTHRGQPDTVTVDGVLVSDQDYNAAGYRTQIDEANSGISSFTYNAFGELTVTTDARGKQVKFTYDDAGRMTTRVDDWMGNDAVTTTWAWDPAGHPGRLGSISTDDGMLTQTQAYDTIGRPTGSTVTLNVPGFPGNGTYQNSILYQGKGQVGTVTHFGGLSNSYTYTAQGHLEAVHHGGTEWHTYLAQNAFGQTIDESMGVIQLRRQHDFDPLTGRLKSILAGGFTPHVVDYHYTWRADGMLATREDRKNTATTSDDVRDTFYHDELNRLIAQVTTEGGAFGRGRYMYYDLRGNMDRNLSTVLSDPDLTSTTYAGGTHPDRLTHATYGGVAHSFDYDANGNITNYNASSGPNTTITYDAANRATAITRGTSTESFWYHPDGAPLVQKSTWDDGGPRTRWTLRLGASTIIHQDPAEGGAVVTHTALTDAVALVRTVDGSGTSQRVELTLRDHLGSPVAVLDASTGQNYGNRSFDPFGLRRSSSWLEDITQVELDDVLVDGATRPEDGLTGHTMLDRVGIVHMGGRLYDPRLGRFLQVDPIVSAPTFTQDWNRYAGMWNNPVGVVDPTGLYEVGDPAPFHNDSWSYDNGVGGYASAIEEVIVKGERIRSGSGLEFRVTLPSDVLAAISDAQQDLEVLVVTALRCQGGLTCRGFDFDRGLDSIADALRGVAADVASSLVQSAAEYLGDRVDEFIEYVERYDPSITIGACGGKGLGGCLSVSVSLSTLKASFRFILGGGIGSSFESKWRDVNGSFAISLLDEKVNWSEKSFGTAVSITATVIAGVGFDFDAEAGSGGAGVSASVGLGGYSGSSAFGGFMWRGPIGD